MINDSLFQIFFDENFWSLLWDENLSKLSLMYLLESWVVPLWMVFELNDFREPAFMFYMFCCLHCSSLIAEDYPFKRGFVPRTCGAQAISNKHVKPRRCQLRIKTDPWSGTLSRIATHWNTAWWVNSLKNVGFLTLKSLFREFLLRLYNPLPFFMHCIWKEIRNWKWI